MTISQHLHLEMDHDEDLEKLDALGQLKIDLDVGLESAMAEMEDLQSEISDFNGDQLIDLCRENIISTVVGQFGLASQVIESIDGGSVTTTHNFEKGITSTDADATKYKDLEKSRSMSGEEWKNHRKEMGYDKNFNQRRKEAFNSQEKIIDAYTGRELPKDGTAHLDHIRSAREFDTDARINLHLSDKDRVELSLSKENLAFTDASINQSKSDQNLDDWMKKERKSGETNETHFDIDREKASKSNSSARKHIDRQVDKAAFKKYSKEVLQTGGKDAAKMAAYSALGIIMKDLVAGIANAVKKSFSEKSMGFKHILKIFKEEMAEVVAKIKKKWKQIVSSSFEAGITAFLSNLVVFMVNLFATTLKKLVSVIRAGFVSLVQALKILANPPANMSKEDARHEALKILTAGIIGALSLTLSASIEKLLQAIPGLQPLMMFPIWGEGDGARTVSDILAVTLSSIAGGILTTIAIYLLDQFRNGGLKSKLEIQLLTQGGLIVQYQTTNSWLVLNDAYTNFKNDIHDYRAIASETRSEMEQSSVAVETSKIGYRNAIQEFKDRRKKR